MGLARTITSLTTLAMGSRERQRAQWYSAGRLARLRASRLERLIKIAGTAPYYRAVFEQTNVTPAGFARDVLADERALARLPLLDKATFKTDPASFLTEPSDQLFTVNSSGSTGEPTQYLRSARDQAHVSAEWARVYKAYGRRPFDTQINIGSGRPAAKAGPVVTLQKLGVLPKLHQLSSFEPMADQIALFRRVRPAVISAYAVGIERLAEAVLAAGVTDIRPRIVYSTGMQLSARGRALAREAFGVPAFDLYASVENGPIAWECPNNLGFLHINDDTMYLEIVDDSGTPVPDGVAGRVVVTPLMFRAQPLIRYILGDLTARQSNLCMCGRGLRLIERVHGRIQHVIPLADGHALNASMTSAIFSPLAEVRRYQVHQTLDGTLRILVVPAPGHADSAAEAVRTAIRTRLGETVKCEIVLCQDIPLAPSGKFQTVVPLGS
jgi:phenylacetate-coenzyme A ligase PaaK-like adenylate-forming protein